MKPSKSVFFLMFCLGMLLFSTGLAAETDLLTKKISIDAEDASIASIIATMAKLSGCNIVLSMESVAEAQDETETPKITIHLKDVPIEQALSLVVKSIGLSYKLVGDKTFIVGEKQKIEEEIGERTYVINLNYVDVDKIVAALEIMPGSAVAIPGQNALLLRANPESYNDIYNKIKEIDVPQKQIQIRARLIEISTTEAEKVGIDWSKLNHLTTILAEDPVGANGSGLPYDYNDDTGELSHGDLEGNAIGELPQDQYFQRISGFDNIGHFSRQLTAFDITIDWLLENNAAKLLTDTRITALNGEEAEIHIGEVVPYVVSDKEYQVQVERENVGIILKIKPTVNKDNQITTKIEPEVSSVLELVGGYVPRTKVRRVISTVTVADGKKIIVGGLLNSNIIQQENKVPFLGDLPWIGKIFRHKYNQVSNTDLIIEITPHIVDSSDSDKEYDLDKRLERKLIREKE